MQPPPATLSVRVRRADMSDLDDLVALEQRAFDGDRMSRAQYRRHLDSDSAQILLASAGQHAFFGNVVLFFRKRCAVARVYSLATRPEARGQGVGAALLAAAAVAAQRRHCRALRLEVRTDNAAAINLYERLGYRRIGTYRHYYEDGADAWRYERTLD
jgi:ribosomal-protein-alanine N-acetyltransferase